VTAEGTVERPRRARWRRFVAPAIGIAAVGATFAFVLPSIADYGSVWETIQTLTWAELGVLTALTALNLATYAPPLQATLPGLSFRPALTVSLASTASTYVAPGGPAVGAGLSFAMLRAWRFDRREITLALTLTGVWNQLFQFGAPALALGLLTRKGTSQHGLLLAVGLIGLGVFVAGAGAFAAALTSGRLAHAVGDRAARVASWALRLVRRDAVTWDGRSLAEFRARAAALLGRRWWLLTLATAVGQLTVFALLLATLRALGVTHDAVDGTEAFAAWSVGRVIGSLPFMPPGGLGVVELGLTGLLIGFGGGAAGVTAAVLLYRALTIVPTLLVGSAGALMWRRHAGAPA
jgi:uncharacterized membrane protein YbhN (UPF0104 family)